VKLDGDTGVIDVGQLLSRAEIRRRRASPPPDDAPAFGAWLRGSPRPGQNLTWESRMAIDLTQRGCVVNSPIGNRILYLNVSWQEILERRSGICAWFGRSLSPAAS
jgi:hypothetical protein